MSRCHIPITAIQQAGAYLVDTAAEVYGAIVMKIAPPTTDELALMNDRSSVFSMLQLSNLSPESIALMMKKMNAIAYELIKDEQKGISCG